MPWGIAVSAWQLRPSFSPDRLPPACKWGDRRKRSLSCDALSGRLASPQRLLQKPLSSRGGRTQHSGNVSVVSADPDLWGLTTVRLAILVNFRQWWRQLMIARARHRPPRPNPNTDADSGERITVISAVVNCGLAMLKLVAGVLGSSAALVADAGHSLSDLVSDGVTFWAVRMAQIPPDSDHPYGHGRFEAVGALGVGMLVVAAGIGIAFEAWSLLRALWCGCAIGLPPSPGALAFSACLASILAKELLYRATDVVGRRLNSPVIRANAAHHRSDVWSSVVAVVGVAGSWLGMRSLDPMGALVVAFMVLRMGGGVMADALGQLTDTTDETILSTVRRAARNVVGVTDVMRARARAMGSDWLVEVEVAGDSFVLSASAADQLAVRVRLAVLAAVPDARECLVSVQSSVRQSQAVARLPSPKEVDAQVRNVLTKLKNVDSVQRTMVHFERRGAWVDVWIAVSPDKTVIDCQSIAAHAQSALLANLTDLYTAHIHLNLTVDGLSSPLALVRSR